MKREGLNLKEVDRVKNITKENFLKNYFQPQKPVIIENYINNHGDNFCHRKCEVI